MPLSDEPLDHQTRVQQLFIEHQQGLRAYVLTIVRDFVLAQDVMQDAFLVVTRKAHEFDLSTNFIAWAATIARFRALDALRQANKPCLGGCAADPMYCHTGGITRGRGFKREYHW